VIRSSSLLAHWESPSLLLKAEARNRSTPPFAARACPCSCASSSSRCTRSRTGSS
jgi:hypothetical protein